MRIQVSNLNQVIYDFVSSAVLPKYAEIWRNQGENTYVVDGKLFALTTASKLLLKEDLTTRFPMLKAFCDSNNTIDVDNVKEVLLETYEEFKSKDRKIVIPYIDWELDSEDIIKLYDISKNYEIKD